MRLLILIACFISLFSMCEARSIASYDCTQEEQQEALAQYHSFLRGIDDSLYKYTVIN